MSNTAQYMCNEALVRRIDIAPRRRNEYNALQPLTFVGEMLIANRNTVSLYLGGSGSCSVSAIEALNVELLVDARGGQEHRSLPPGSSNTELYCTVQNRRACTEVQRRLVSGCRPRLCQWRCVVSMCACIQSMVSTDFLEGLRPRARF